MNKKKIILIGVISFLIGGLISFLIFNNKCDKLSKLPLPEVTGGERGILGIDKNINEEIVDFDWRSALWLN